MGPGISTRTRRTLLWLLLPIGLLLAGVATYLSGALEPQGEGAQTAARMELSSPALDYAYGSSTLLTLPWGDGDDAAALMPGGGTFMVSTVEAVISEPDGAFLLVDHPSWHRGARVRRYSPQGLLVDRVLTPPGSTLFASDGRTLAYIVAKQEDGSERLVLSDSSGETTYVVPLNTNSGGIVQHSGGVWVRTTSSSYSPQSQEVTATSVLIPVVRDGVQVSEDEARDAIREGWYASASDLFERTQVVSGQGDTASVFQSIRRVSDGKELEVPGRSVPLGVDDQSSVYVLVEPRSRDSIRQHLALYPAALERTERVLVSGFDGAVRSLIILPAPPLTRTMPSRISLSANGDLLAVLADSEGVRVVRYEVNR